MKKKIMFLNLFFFICCAFIMFGIKYKFQQFNKEFVKVKHELDAEQEENKVLRAEYAYMSSPKRLAMLAAHYLNHKQQNAKNFDQHLHKKIYGHDSSVFKLVNGNFSRHN
ncbi:hypothetical protein CAXC1_120060 [Candidatus Xenohaliotis californiensis]|uniref:Cell division protein FtsL n=1 Tax=Candidatus Xenohaliotis californiensis TaxID=84677 RepID=A0ABP0EUC1_9RICK|nr:hypothetical protein CAXC1_120060 [Candidatus Xenohaliotis californiensis]